ncbi:hypothetical protein PV10_02410 [Exophiala mesophila]|uniref:Pyrroloquinoline quinone-dependent pyranose dehydrogenase beta-propeller domain-containing protein n=1 Tax=Exophiala mesophila TaxID=212818 RepID=A0A0D1Y278_EXOME|nr:uncharacterized protein PV10_02410 [Exophiala mesophila]KIV94666.1 hypothetical protein PV10_02410 [Exophiala mesophila]
MRSAITTTLGAALLLPSLAFAQSSGCGPAPSNGIRPSIASGYTYQVVATGLSRPRGIHIDTEGNLLVVERGKGAVTAHTLEEENGCVSIASSTDVTGDVRLNHGIELSPDGTTLYASNSDDMFSWTYDPSTRTVSNRNTLITNLTGVGHSTRTLLLSRKTEGMMVVSKGSMENIDILAYDVSTGSSQVKAFNLTNVTDPYDYNNEGLLMGWGLRNEVGIGEHPESGGIWGIENSADELFRHGVDIHRNNPAEKINFLGYLDGTEYEYQGANFGYPWCFPVWEVEELPQNENLTVGSQFAIDSTPEANGQNRTDEYCAETAPPRLSFQAHMAPLDIKFNNSGQEAWIAWHGSWNRDDPVGYALSVVSWEQDGEPTDPPDSMTAKTDIFGNEDLSRCPGNCHRPVAMAIDAQGRIYLTSDSSGEIYLITKLADSDDGGDGDSDSDGDGGSGEPDIAGLPLHGQARLCGLAACLLSVLAFFVW